MSQTCIIIYGIHVHVINIDNYMNISKHRVILGHREPRMETSLDMSAKYIICIPKESETHNNTCMLRLCWFIGSTEIRIMAALRLDVHTQYCDSSVDIPEHSLAQVLTVLLQRCCQLYCRHLFLQKQKFIYIWKNSSHLSMVIDEYISSHMYKTYQLPHGVVNPLDISAAKINMIKAYIIS